MKTYKQFITEKTNPHLDDLRGYFITGQHIFTANEWGEIETITAKKTDTHLYVTVKFSYGQPYVYKIKLMPGKTNGLEAYQKLSSERDIPRTAKAYKL